MRENIRLQDVVAMLFTRLFIFHIQEIATQTLLVLGGMWSFSFCVLLRVNFRGVCSQKDATSWSVPFDLLRKLMQSVTSCFLFVCKRRPHCMDECSSFSNP